MKSDLPKVLHPIAGRPMVEHVLSQVTRLKPQKVAVVVGVQAERIRQALMENGWNHLTYIRQSRPLGSGHAVREALPWLRRQDDAVLVLYGDAPLLKASTLQELISAHKASGNAATFLTMDLACPTGYGRIQLDPEGFVERIIEERDATPEERLITLVNSGVACWQARALAGALPLLANQNAKKEYYLTDAAALLRQRGHRVGLVRCAHPEEATGVNTRVELATAEGVMRQRILQRWMEEGVTIQDPATTRIESEVVIGRDTLLLPGTILEGRTRIGKGCRIGPYVVLESSTVEDGARVGPFAHIRPGSVIRRNARVGNFVELKNARLGAGARANHLTYLGDAEIGAETNVGAGTITCNYDGYSKHRTTIGRKVFVGSDVSLVAPVRVGEGAVIAAGSTITEDVPPGALAIARERQLNKTGWVAKWKSRQSKKR